MHHENNGDPNRYKLSRNRDELQPKPNFADIRFIDNTPCVVKGD